MDDVTTLIRTYAGTTLTDAIQKDVVSEAKSLLRYQCVGNYLFYVEKMCRCNDECEYLTCPGTSVYEMIGLVAKRW